MRCGIATLTCVILIGNMFSGSLIANSKPTVDVDRFPDPDTMKWPPELSPGIDPQPYDYFNPIRSGDITLLVSTIDVWDQITPSSIAGAKRYFYAPVDRPFSHPYNVTFAIWNYEYPDGPTQMPDYYTSYVIRQLAERHHLHVLLVGNESSLSPGLSKWFDGLGCDVDRISSSTPYDTYVLLAEEEIKDPKIAVFTTFNPMAGYLSAVYDSPAFPLRFLESLPDSYVEYLAKHENSIETVYLVDVAENIGGEQSYYKGYGNLKVPTEIENQLRSLDFNVIRISGEYEEDVSIAIADLVVNRYKELVEQRVYDHVPLGWIPCSSMRSEWTNVPSMIPVAIAKQWIIIEQWTPNPLIPTDKKSLHSIGVLQKWLSNYIGSNHITDFTACLGIRGNGENAAPHAFYTQLFVEEIALIHPPLYRRPPPVYHTFGAGGGLAGPSLNATESAWQSRAVILIALERFLFPPVPWSGRTDLAWPPPQPVNKVEGPFALSMCSDYEGWFAYIFTTPRLIDIASRYDAKLNLRTIGDFYIYLPDYIRTYYDSGIVEFCPHGFIHEIDLAGISSSYPSDLPAYCCNRMVDHCGLKPVGWMMSGGKNDEETLEVAKRYGYSYSHSPPTSILVSIILTAITTTLCNVPLLGGIQYSMDHLLTRAGLTAMNLTFIGNGFTTGAVNGFGDGGYQTAIDNFVRSYDLCASSSKVDHFLNLFIGHGFEFYNDASLKAFEGFVEYVYDNYVSTGKIIFATSADVDKALRSCDGGVADHFESYETTPGLSSSAISRDGGQDHLIPGFEAFILAGELMVCSERKEGK